jgi:hypothetical protein
MQRSILTKKLSIGALTLAQGITEGTQDGKGKIVNIADGHSRGASSQCTGQPTTHACEPWRFMSLISMMPDISGNQVRVKARNAGTSSSWLLQYLSHKNGFLSSFS